MIVLEADSGKAKCEGMGVNRVVDTLLVGNPQPGTWLLVFMNSAREVLSAEQAARITDGVTAVDQIMSKMRVDYNEIVKSSTEGSGTFFRRLWWSGPSLSWRKRVPRRRGRALAKWELWLRWHR